MAMMDKRDELKKEKPGCALAWLKVLALLIGFSYVFYLAVWRVPDHKTEYTGAVERSRGRLTASGVPRPENGWYDYEKAMMELKDLIPTNPPVNPAIIDLDRCLESGLTGSDRSIVEKILRENTRAFTYINEGCKKPLFQVPSDISLVIGHSNFLYNYSGVEKLGKLLIILGDREREKGQLKKSMHFYLQAMCLGNGLGRCGYAPYYFTGERITRKAANRLEVILSRPETDAAQCRFALVEIRRIGKDMPSFQDLMCADISISMETYENAKNYPARMGVDNKWALPLLMPYFDREMRVMGNYYLEASRESTKSYREFSSFLSAGRKPLFSIVLGYTIPAWRTCYPLYCGSKATYGGVEIFCALQCHEKEKGRYPSDLQALVPDYLSSLPADPFADNGQFVYRMKGKLPIFYSVGFNGNDEGGGVQAKNPDGDGDIIFMDGKEH